MRFIFIPIKEHSERVPNKNFRLFNGNPLYIHALLKYEDLDIQIFIDTDSEKIVNTIEQMHETEKLKNVHCFYRKENLRGDNVSVNFLIEDFIDSFFDTEEKKKNALIAQIHVTNPFLSAQTVISAFEKLESGSCDSVVSSTVYNARFWRKEKYGFCPLNHNPMKLERTQDLPELYEENSCFYVFNAYIFKKNGSNRIGKTPFFMSVDFPEYMDIDTEQDWNRCVSMLASS